MTASPIIEPLGDSAVLVQFGDVIAASTNARVHAAARTIAAQSLPGIVEIVPGYASLAVVFDADVWQRDEGTPAEHCGDALRAALDAPMAPVADDSAVVEIPVCYGGAFGPDLDEAAARSDLTPQQFAQRHAAGNYRVAMLGFAAGFPYLLGLDPALQQPRRASPRTRVPAGSIAIGGAQTGVYPRELPGGWNLIGRTPLALFDANATPPNRLSAGTRVRFVAIDADAFAATSG